MNDAITAFGEVDFSWVRSVESVWSDGEAPIAGPNDALEDVIVATLLNATKDPTRKPPGRVLVGRAGIGKTHLVGNLRRKIWSAGGWFVLLDVIGITDFWKSAALSFLVSLLQQMPDGRRQSDAVLAGVARRLNVEPQVEAAFRSPEVSAKQIIDLLVPGLMRIDFSKAQVHQDVFRALAMLRSHDMNVVGIAHSWLQGYEADEDARKALGLTKPPPEPVALVRGMSWVMSLSGPTLVAVDQIDGVISSGDVTLTDPLGEKKSFGDLLSAGLLQLYDGLSRSQAVITCLLSSWEELQRGGLASATDRFQTPPTSLVAMSEPACIAALIHSRLAPAYRDAGVPLDNPTGPFTPAAIESARGMTPRQILMACDAHWRRCLAQGAIEPCDSLTNDSRQPPPSRTADAFDGKLDAARRAATIDGLVNEKDDGEMGRLLRDVFDMYAKQIVPRDSYDVESRSDPAQKSPPLHGRLTFTFHDKKDQEAHYCFRAIEHAHAISFAARLRAALTAAGIGARIPGRHLLIVRRAPIPSGAKTKQLFNAFLEAGGKVIDPTDDDLRTFSALRAIRDDAAVDGKTAAFEAWLLERGPLCETGFFATAGLCPPADLPAAAAPVGAPPAPEPTPPPPNEQATTEPSSAPPPPGGTTIRIGRRLGEDAAEIDLPTNLLPRHTAIIAGAGSGKTVLLRRIVEEAALVGIPAIVIDPNNDLSRLGDKWPERPAAFSAADDAKAQRYFRDVEVVVWTPGIHAGNPLFLPVLPDFAAVGDDPDERFQAVTMAADTLAPLAGAKANLQRGVLADALRHFAAAGGGSLKDMTALLADLPDGVSDIDNATKLATKMANELKAAVATNPLLKTVGPVLDPALLFFGKDRARTRISVINLSGLASNDAREDLVNRLQMTLFGWIKKHPSPKGLLLVIDEAQSFIPSVAPALSKTSGVQLVAQARKYGLGIIAATQAPKGIDNKVVSNCTTQFLGKQNAPATIEAAKDLIAASGGKADDIGKLPTGEFYFKTEKSGKPFKLKTPICLSYHPPNPPTPEEVVARAKRSAA